MPRLATSVAKRGTQGTLDPGPNRSAGEKSELKSSGSGTLMDEPRHLLSTPPTCGSAHFRSSLDQSRVVFLASRSNTTVS